MLKTKEGLVASEVPSYASPPEGESWALIEDVWQYTNQPTPGFANIKSSADSEDDGDTSALTSSAPKPCAANQYRSPETNRCRLIATAASAAVAVCKVGQERNAATNRCRNITPTTTAAACKEGQERNTETNRCRNIKQLSTAGFGVKGATTKQGGVGWYLWAAIVGVVVLVIGYAVWEWRAELQHVLKMVQAKFAGRVN